MWPHPFGAARRVAEVMDPPGAVAAGQARPHAREMLATFRRVSKSFGPTVAIAQLDFALNAGELLVVLGPNGAGKSTLVGLLLGLLRPDWGDVEIVGGAPSIERRRQVGVMLQDAHLPPDLKVREILALVSSYYPSGKPTDQLLEETGLSSIAHRMYRPLSGGQKRLVQFALALCGQPRLLVLDEPTTGLDLSARERVWKQLRAFVEAGGGVVLNTHHFDEAEALADRVLVLSNGQAIASGSVEEVRGMIAASQIACSTSLALEQIGRWPGVLEVRKQGDRTILLTSEPEEVLRTLLEFDPTVTATEVRRAGLSEAFAALMLDSER